MFSIRMIAITRLAQRTKSFFTVLGLSGLILLAACHRHPPNPAQLTLLIWGDPAEIKITLDLIAQFEKKHPDIKIHLEHPRPGMAYPSQLQYFINQNKTPDVFFIEVGNFKLFPRKDICLDLMPFLQRDHNFNLANYYPEIVNQFYEGKKLCILPRDIAPHACVFYNKALFRKAGIPFPRDNWEWPKDFLPIAQKLTKRDAQGKIQCYGFTDDWPYWEAFVLSNGGQLVDNPMHPGMITLANTGASTAIQFYSDLTHKYQVMPPLNDKSFDEYFGNAIMFTSGKTAMYLSGIWRVPLFSTMSDFDWDLVLFPKGPNGQRRFLTGGSGYGIATTSPHPAAAWELVKFLAGPIGQASLSENGLIQPADMRLARSSVFLKTPQNLNKKPLVAAAHQADFYPISCTWDYFLARYMAPALFKIDSGAATAEEILPALINQANQEFFPQE